MSDITNYGYIWYRTDGRLLVDFTKEEKDAIFQIITNYSYPCYLSGSDLIKGLLPKNKAKLLAAIPAIQPISNEDGLGEESDEESDKGSDKGSDEESDKGSDKGSDDSFEEFMKEQKKHANKLIDGDSDVDSYGHDRPSYGYKKELGGQSAKEFPTKRSYIPNMTSYNVLIRRYTDLVKEHIFLLNAFIIERIYHTASSPISPTSPKSPTSPTSQTSPKSPKSPTSPTSPKSPSWAFDVDSPSPKRKPSPQQYVLDNFSLLIEFFNTHGVNAFGLMLEDIFKSQPGERIFFNPITMNIFGMKLTKTARHAEINFQITFSDKTKELFRQTIDFEKQPSEGKSILYRGALLENDSLLVEDTRRMQSISFNQSLISGCVTDDTACTLFYMEQTSTPWLEYQATTKTGTKTGAEKNDCIKYNIKKFLLGDSSAMDSLFFIPPIHPFLQVYCEGELFHPRTKVSDRYHRETYATKQKRIRGIFCSYDFVMNCDYLISDKSIRQLNALYQRFKSTCMIDRLYSNRVKQSIHEQQRASRESSAREAAGRALKRSRSESLSRPESSPRTARLRKMSSDTMQGAGRRRKKSRKVIKRVTRRVKHTKYKYNSSRRLIKNRR